MFQYKLRTILIVTAIVALIVAIGFGHIGEDFQQFSMLGSVAIFGGIIVAIEVLIFAAALLCIVWLCVRLTNAIAKRLQSLVIKRHR